MNSTFLRIIRIVISIVFFTATTIVLIDITELVPLSVTKGVIYFQFVPSLLHALIVFSISTTGFLLIFVLTFLFGRIYCSTICPLGFLQDVINYIAKKTKHGKRKFAFFKEHKIIRWIFLGVPIILFLFGLAIGINFLDPYSIYGRIVFNLFRPIAVLANNLLASILEMFKVYSLYAVEIKAINIIPILISIAFFVFVAYLSYKKGRLYCNTVCPVGTLLGFISKFSILKINIIEEECLACGVCAKVCKSNCINAYEKNIDMSRCVVCFDCLSSCPTDSINYKYSFRSKKGIKTEPALDVKKRNFLINTAMYFTALSPILAQAKKKIVVTKKSKIPILRKNAVSPPGSIGLERFNSKCTACGLCVTSCPTQVLQPSFLEYGILGIMQPRMDNNAGFCNFDCTICGEVCPTGAILPLQKEAKQLVQLGKAKFIEDNCIVKTQGTDCGACSEHCPTKAVHMVPYKNKLVIPEIREEYCIGCGACEYACPVKPYKAIYVEGNSVHQTAKKNIEQQKPQEKIDLKEDFPF